MPACTAPAWASAACSWRALNQLGPDDVLVLDRGYPAAWWVALLSARGIRFVIRCDNDCGWGAAKAFRRSGALDSTVMLNPPSADDVCDWDCPAQAPWLHLVRQIATNGQIRLLATNIDAEKCPAAMFGDLYHQRWRIEQAFKLIKHRLYLEAVSGLSQQALIIDVAAKILADNITSLMCAAAADHAGLRIAPTPPASCNRSCHAWFCSWATSVLPSTMPSMPLAPTRSDTSLAAPGLVPFVMTSLIRHAPTKGEPNVRWIGV